MRMAVNGHKHLLAECRRQDQSEPTRPRDRLVESAPLFEPSPLHSTLSLWTPRLGRWLAGSRFRHASETTLAAQKIVDGLREIGNVKFRPHARGEKKLR